MKNTFKPNQPVIWIHEDRGKKNSFHRYIPATVVKKRFGDFYEIDTYCPDTFEKKNLVVDGRNLTLGHDQ